MESLAVTRLHAPNGALEFGQHLALAHEKLEVRGLTAFKHFAVNLAFEVHGDAVALRRYGILGALGETATLFAQDVDRLVDRRFTDLGFQLFHFGCGKISNRYLGKDFEDRIEGQLAFG